MSLDNIRFTSSPYGKISETLMQYNKFSDFGVGLYLYDDINYARRKASRKGANHIHNKGFIGRYMIPDKWPNELKVKRFQGMSESWLGFVLENRGENIRVFRTDNIVSDDYDIIIGPVMDERILYLIDRFLIFDNEMKNRFKTRKEFVVNFKEILLTEIDEVPIQICLKTKKALEAVTFLYMEENISDYSVFSKEFGNNIVSEMFSSRFNFIERYFSKLQLEGKGNIDSWLEKHGEWPLSKIQEARKAVKMKGISISKDVWTTSICKTELYKYLMERKTEFWMRSRADLINLLELEIDKKPIPFFRYSVSD